MALSKSIMRNIARFRIRGHGLKCETGLYGRSPDRSARVCNLCENGDYIQDEKHVIFSCIGTEHLRHQFIHLFIIFLKVISKVLFFNITMVTMVTMGGALQPGSLADRLLTGLGQPQINP